MHYYVVFVFTYGNIHLQYNVGKRTHLGYLILDKHGHQHLRTHFSSKLIYVCVPDFVWCTPDRAPKGLTLTS